MRAWRGNAPNTGRGLRPPRRSAKKVQQLAKIRADEGYMAEVKRDGAGFLFIENHCPICAAATACQGFCASELDLFRSALGPGVSVERAEHIISGDRRCAYRIAQAGRIRRTEAL